MHANVHLVTYGKPDYKEICMMMAPYNEDLDSWRKTDPPFTYDYFTEEFRFVPRSQVSDCLALIDGTNKNKAVCRRKMTNGKYSEADKEFEDYCKSRQESWVGCHITVLDIHF